VYEFSANFDSSLKLPRPNPDISLRNLGPSWHHPELAQRQIGDEQFCNFLKLIFKFLQMFCIIYMYFQCKGNGRFNLFSFVRPKTYFRLFKLKKKLLSNLKINLSNFFARGVTSLSYCPGKITDGETRSRRTAFHC